MMTQKKMMTDMTQRKMMKNDNSEEKHEKV